MEPLSRCIHFKLKGGALQYTISFSLLILLGIFSFLLFIRLRGVELTFMQIDTGLTMDIRSSTLIMEESPDVFGEPEDYLSLYADGFTDSVRVSVREWGFYHIVTFRSEHRRFLKQKCFLYTDDIHRDQLKPSLYFSDPHRYLSIGGNTYLGNNCYLPAYGVRKAYFNGIGYYRDSLIQGVSFPAEDELPPLRGKLEHFYHYLTDRITEQDSSVTLETLLPEDTVFNSFGRKRLIVYCPEDAILENIHMEGNILLTGSTISIRKTASIENCMVVAENVKIEDHFRGTGQIIATRHIAMGDSCAIYSPSVLYCGTDGSEGSIHIGERSFFFGDIIFPVLVSSSNETVIIGEGAMLAGQVYCNGLVSFKGTLFGSMYCKGFIYRTENGLNNDFLLNVCIDRERLPKEYGGVTVTGKENGKKCMLEVY